MSPTGRTGKYVDDLRHKSVTECPLHCDQYKVAQSARVVEKQRSTEADATGNVSIS